MISSQPHTQPAATLDDSGAGLAMFMIFTVAVLIVTGAVVLVALVGAWWMVGFAFAVHVIMTTVVVATILNVMDGRASANADRAAAKSHHVETRPPARHEPAAAL